MKRPVTKNKKLLRIIRVRRKIRGTIERPRLHVFRSNRYTYTQIINDDNGKTLVAASAHEVKSTGTKTEQARALGALIAQKAKQKKISRVAFDRGANQYLGRLKALAEAAREGGLEF